MSNFAHANKGTTYIVNHYLATKHIGIWCNGNTTDSGPVILGSSPSIPTKLFKRAASLFLTLGYGVMVTLQILVLSFLVRVRVSQLSKAYSLRIGFFRILPYPTFFGSTLHCTHKKQTRVFRTRRMLLVSSYIRVCPKYPCSVIIL